MSTGEMEVTVFGNSGSGKSTYARALSAEHGPPHLDLDSIVWEPGKIGVQRTPEAISGLLEDFISANPEWVIEGCYGDLVESVSAQGSV
jgi:adenylate kinase family enzyme